MRAEYLLFNLIVAVPVLVLSLFPPPFFVRRWGAAFRAVLLAAVPFLVWDALVAGRHWWWNPRFVLGPRLFGLPVEEILFFFTVPFASLFSWETLFHGERDAPRSALRVLYAPALLLVPLGAFLFVTEGREYTGLALAAFGLTALLDLLTGTRVLARPSFLRLTVFVAVCTTVFNGYLTARPVVLYDPRYQLGAHVGTIPVEDYVYGLGLVFLAAVHYQRAVSAAAGKPGVVARWIEARLGGYRQTVVTPDPAAPLRREDGSARRVAVVGSGIAGLTAASVLADRGFEVVIFERNAYLGGKVGSWPVTLGDGDTVQVSHGFHAFFRQYYNLRRWMARLGADAHLTAISDYLILDREGRPLSFGGTATTPVLNLLSLAGRGVFRLRDAVFDTRMHRLDAMLRYDADRTSAAFDEVPFARFAAEAGLPPRLTLAFETFGRAFFAEADRMSTAELIKGFHFYYLSNDAGLLYDYLDDDYERTLLAPARAYLAARGVRVALGAPVPVLSRAAGGGVLVRGEVFGEVILAADAKAARAILTAEGSIAAEAPAFLDDVSHLSTSQRYAVLRLWLDRDARADLPVFFCTERHTLLDAMTLVHRAEGESRAWAAEHGGGVYELHCYAVPDAVTGDEAIRRQLVADMERFLPELLGARVLHEHLYVRDDFTAFHVGMAARRPTVETPVPGLLLAGDWVKLPRPAMLMEAACTSGLLAANAVLRRSGLREELVESVPAKGLLAGVPERPVARSRK